MKLTYKYFYPLVIMSAWMWKICDSFQAINLFKIIKVKGKRKEHWYLDI